MNTFMILLSGFMLATAMRPRELNLEDDFIMLENQEPVEISTGEINSDLLQRTESKQEVSEVNDIRVKRDIETLYLRVLAVIDHSIYSHWLAVYNEDVNKTIQAIRYYYAQMLNSVASKYASIDTGSYKYVVTTSGFYIAQTINMSSFTESDNVKVPNSTLIKYGAVLWNLANWSEKNSKTLPSHAVAAGFTRYGGTSVTGLAYVGTACSKWGVFIANAGPMSIASVTAAHEMGHVLGMNHDGEKNNCSTKVPYVMCPYVSFSKVTNYHTFSNCSRTNIENYMNRMGKAKRGTCFKEESSQEEQDIKKYLEELPGIGITPDQECRNNLGSKSYFCPPGASAQNDICQGFRCFHPGKNSCVGVGNGCALDGTPCGNKSWCINKQCVFDERAPASSDSCLYGDSKDPVNHKRMKYYCSDIAEKLSLCSEDVFKKKCCKSCDENTINCPYGDSKDLINLNFRNNAYCNDSIQRPYLCYNKDFEKQCCKTCPSLKKPEKKNCTYGDSNDFGPLAINCTEMVRNPFLCNYITYALKCCETCPGLKKSENENCKYGDTKDPVELKDKNYSCSDAIQNPQLCSNADFELMCCETCAKVKSHEGLKVN